MKQILHIFQKDARRHWPEILVSLLLLALFVHYQLNPWNPEFGPSFSILLVVIKRYISGALTISWCFLILRIVHGDNLVGDRQWWITKPYVWWKLLLAKLLFVAVFISVPLFHAQLFLLHHAGFPVLANIPALLLGQLTLFISLFFLIFFLGSITKNLAQVFLLVVLAVFSTLGITWLESAVPSSGMSFVASTADSLSSLVILGSAVAITLWQFARRRTWQSRAIVLGIVVAIAALSVATPYRAIVERKYPLVEQKAAPASFSLLSLDASQSPAFPDFARGSQVLLALPLNVSGIAPGSLVKVEAVIIRSDSLDSGPAKPGWVPVWQSFWTEGGQFVVTYLISRKEFEKLKSQNVHVELALSEFRETHPRESTIDPGALAREGLGHCRFMAHQPRGLECLQAIRNPRIMATYDSSKSTCSSQRDVDPNSSGNIYHYWNSDHMGSSEPILNPIADYSIYFQPKPTIPKPRPPDQSAESQSLQPQLCLGAPFHLAEPVLRQTVRVNLDTPNLRFQDLAIQTQPGSNFGTGVVFQ